MSIERVEEFLLLDERAPVSGAESVECSKVNGMWQIFTANVMLY